MPPGRGLVLASLLLLAVAPSRAPPATEIPAENAKGARTSTVILTGPQLEIRVACAESATMADRDFIGFELENRTSAPLALSVMVDWDYELQEATTGALLASGSMQSYPAEALRQALGSPNGDGPVLLPPGITAVRDTPGDGVRLRLGLGRASLRIVPRGPGEPAIGDAPMRVVLRPSAHARLEGGSSLPPVDPPPVVAFTWSLPDEAGLARLGDEARALLALPVDAARASRETFARLLEDERVAQHVPRDALLDALQRRLSPEGGADPRDAVPIAACVARLHSGDPEVRAFVLDALARRQRAMLHWLADVPALWSDEYLPLVRRMAWAPRTDDLLSAHASPRVPDSPEILVQSSPGAPPPEVESSWQLALSAPPAGEPAITDDAVIVQGRDGTVHAAALGTGAPLWTARVTSDGWGVQAVAPAGKLVVVAVVRHETYVGDFPAALAAADDDRLAVLTEFVALRSRDGRVAWRSRDTDSCTKAGGLIGDVVLFETRPRRVFTYWTTGSRKRSLAALDVATGAPRWKAPIHGSRQSAVVSAATSVAFLAMRDGLGRIEAHDLATGAPLVRAPGGAAVEGGSRSARLVARSHAEAVAIAQGAHRLVIGEVSEPTGGTISAWSAGADEPHWTIEVGHRPTLASAGAVVLVSQRADDGAIVQALDPATGGLRWTASGEVLASSPESAMIVPRLEGAGGCPIPVTWRDPASGTVQATRSCCACLPCAASGRRLVCAGSGMITSNLPDDTAPMALWSEADAGAERIAWRARFDGRANGLAVAAGVACIGHGAESVTAFDAATGRELWSKRSACFASPAAWPRGAAFRIPSSFDFLLLDAKTGTERRRARRVDRSEFDGEAGLDVAVTSTGPPWSAGTGIAAVEIATGDPAWKIASGEPGAFEPALLDGDQVIAMLPDGRVRAWRIPDGAPRWTVDAGLAADDRLAGRPVRSGETLVLSTRAGRIVALRRDDGSLRWTRKAEGVGVGRASERGGMVYLSISRRHPDDPSALEAETGRVVWGSAPIDADAGAPLPWRDLLLYACEDGFLRAVRAADGSVAWSVTIGGALLPPTLAGDLLIVGSRTGNVAAVRLAS